MKLYLIFIFLGTACIVAKSCPNVCICKGKSVKCEGKALKSVPVDIPTDTIYLDISNNLIKNLSGNSFNTLSKLRTLKINRNEMKIIHKDAFVGLSRLRNLYLTNNDISELHEETFTQLKDLLHLYLGGNEFETIPKLISFSMTRLNLDNNKIRNGFIDKSFLKNTELQTIVLTKNQIEILKEDDFNNLKQSKITSLMLKFNNLRDIHANTFVSVRDTLKTLELESNPLLGDKILENALKGFKGSSQMLMLDLQNVGLYNISKDFFKPFSRSKLHEIKLDKNNKLVSINPESFQDLIHVQILTINKCILKQSDINFSAMSKLRILDLSHNDLIRCPYRLPGSLQKIDLEFNKIRKIYKNDFKSLSNLKELNLHANSLTDIEQKSFEDFTNLQYLNISHNHIENIPSNVFINLINLKVLKLNQQRDCIKEINYKKIILPNLEYLDLNSNCIQNINNFCVYIPKLKILTMSNNNLKNLSETSFKSCTNLINLDLSNNMIEKWSKNTFVPMSKTLEVLIMSSNRITTIPKDNMPYFNRIRKLELNDNKWNCESCFNIDWLLYMRKFLINFNKMICDKTTNLGELIYLESIYSNHTCVIETREVDYGKINQIIENNKVGKGIFWKIFIPLCSFILIFFIIFIFNRRHQIRRKLSRCKKPQFPSINNATTNHFANRHAQNNFIGSTHSRMDLIGLEPDDDLVDAYNDDIPPFSVDSLVLNEEEEEEEEVHHEDSNEIKWDLLPKISITDPDQLMIVCPATTCYNDHQSQNGILCSKISNLNDKINISNCLYAPRLIIHVSNSNLSTFQLNHPDFSILQQIINKKQLLNQDFKLFIFSDDYLMPDKRDLIKSYFQHNFLFANGNFESFLIDIL